MARLFQQIQVWIIYLYQFENTYLCKQFELTNTKYFFYYTFTNTGSKIIEQIQQI